MKNILTLCILSITILSGPAWAEPVVTTFNELGIGKLSGRLQSLSMYRDYDNGNNGHSTTLGLKLDYLSPEKEGWTIGASYIGAGVIDSMDYDTSSNPGEALLANGRVNVLNEAYLSYSMKAFGLTNTSAVVGRKVNNGEVFRADDFRQKPRSIEAVSVESRDFHKTRIQIGHAWEMSNWIQFDDRWKFEEFDRLGTENITWGEVVNSCIDGLEVALFDAYANDLSNLLGTRAKWNMSDETALLGYYRNESNVGDSAKRHSDVFGFSVEQKVDGITLEGGYLGVHGNDLRFQELTTGINHALGASMEICSCQFNGGADTLYLKAVTKIEKTKTVLYGLYNFTWQDHSKTPFDGQELNIVVKQPIPKFDNLTVAFKGGVGYRDGKKGTTDITQTDARLFITYTF